MTLLESERKEWAKIRKIAKANKLYAKINDIGKVDFGKGFNIQVTNNVGLTPLTIIEARARLKKRFPNRNDLW